ncbi:MAG: hypothetical protein ACREXX_13960 [Gammaproteobacteria bacterium]
MSASASASSQRLFELLHGLTIGLIALVLAGLFCLAGALIVSGLALGAGGLYAAEHVGCWRANRRNARLRSSVLLLVPQREPMPPPPDLDVPLAFDDLAGAAMPAERTAPLSSTGERYRRLRELRAPGPQHALNGRAR